MNQFWGRFDTTKSDYWWNIYIVLKDTLKKITNNSIIRQNPSKAAEELQTIE